VRRLASASGYIFVELRCSAMTSAILFSVRVSVSMRIISLRVGLFSCEAFFSEKRVNLLRFKRLEIDALHFISFIIE